MKHKILILLFAIGSLVGCASGPSHDPSFLDSIGPTFTQYSADIPGISAGSGRIYIYHYLDYDWLLSNERVASVRINNKFVATSYNGGFFFVDRPAGSYEVKISGGKLRKLQINLQSGEEKYINLFPKSDRSRFALFLLHKALRYTYVDLKLVDSAVGKAEIAEMRYRGCFIWHW